MSKKINITAFVGVVLLLVLSSFTIYHKFYVSVTQIDYNENKSRIEISTRIFIDDLEKTLDKKYGKKLNIDTKKESKEAVSYIEKYLLEKLKVTVNNKEKSLVFLGKEYEDDVVICYLKVDCSKKIATFDFYNTILTEMFSEQQNIVHTNINNKKESFLLTSQNKSLLTTY